MTKRVISILLILVMLTGMLPVFAQAQEEPTTAVDNGDLTVEGTNGFGNLLAEDISQAQTDLEDQAASGYTLTGLEITGNTATVTYDSLEEATVVVAIYTEDGMQLLTSGKATVIPEETTATVTIEGEMPQYFQAVAYLLDSYDMSPLCSAYDTPMYTKGMQELLASTVEDYDQNRVLQLEENTETNFAVYAENVKIIDRKEGINTVVSIDQTTNTYVLENVDETISSLQAGDIFSYSYSDDDVLIAKVGTITVEGTVATITGAELEIQEVFSQMKIEGRGDNEDIVVDDSNAAEGITYVGLVETSPKARALGPIEGGDTNTVYHEFDFGVAAKESTDYWETSVTIKGTFRVQMTVSVDYYIWLDMQYLEVIASPEITVGVDIEGSFKGEVPVGEFRVSVCPGVNVGFAPKLVLEFAGKLGLNVTASMTFGFRLRGLEMKNLTTTPEIDVHIDVEGYLFWGIDWYPNITIIEEDIVRAGLSVVTGLAIHAKVTGSNYEALAPNTKARHSCEKCIAFDINFEASIEGELEFFDQDWLYFPVTFGTWTVPLGNAYYSHDYREFGFGICPKIKHRITIDVVGNNNTPISGVSITTGSGENLGSTNSNGVLVVYLPVGDYSFTAMVDGAFLTEHVRVDQASRVVINSSSVPLGFMQLVTSTPNKGYVDAGKVLDSGNCGYNGSDVYWDLYTNGTLRIYGKGTMADYKTHSTAPWYNYRSQVKSVVVEYGVKNIGWNAFREMTNLTEATIPNTVTEIDHYAFADCTKLTSFPVSDRIVRIGDKAFQNCNLVYTTYNNGKYLGNSKNPYHALIGPVSTSVSSFSIHPNAKVIGNMAFDGCSSLTSITIPDGVIRIGGSAFRYCSSLTEVTLPDSAYYLGENVFRSCSKLTKVKLPNSITNIPKQFFKETGVKNVTIPDGVTSIGADSFLGCTNLYSVRIPKSVESIGANAFTNCTNLADIYYEGTKAQWNEISIDSTNDAYLKDVFIYTNNAGPGDNIVIASGSCGASGAKVYWSLSSNAKLRIYGTGEMANYEDLTTVPWYNYRKRITSVVIEPGVTKIGWNALREQSKLSSVSIPNSVTWISDYVFYDCSSLTTLSIPDSVIWIGRDAFNGCSKLNYNVWSYGKYLGNANNPYRILAGSTSSSLSSFTINPNTKVIAGHALPYNPNLTSLTVPHGVVSFGQHVVRNCTSLKSVYLPNSLRRIGSSTFIQCTALEEITIPDKVTYIDIWAFYGCTNLETLVLPAGLTKIDEYAFENCPSLKTIYFKGTRAQWNRVQIADHNSGIKDENVVCSDEVVLASLNGEELMAENVQYAGGLLGGTVGNHMETSNAVFSGECTSEQTETAIVKTAVFSDLVPGKEYVLLVMNDTNAEELLGVENLLFIDQGVAAEDGTLSFRYIQRVDTDIAYVLACGASNLDLEAAQITLPKMQADGETQICKPTVVYEGNTLTEGIDYVVLGDGDFEEAGEYTCYIRGIRNYSGIVTCTYSVDQEQSFAWEGNGSDFASVYGNGYSYNDTVLLSGTYTGGTDTMTSAQYALSEPVTLLHNQPWVLEWKSGGSTYAGGIMLLSTQSDSSVDGNLFVHLNQSYVFFGYRNSLGNNNSAITWATIAEKLGSSAGANIRKEMLEFKVVNIPDGENNQLWLYVNGVQIGTMDEKKMIYGDAGHESAAAINLSGKDFKFNYIGSSDYPLNNCNISYIRVFEGGRLKPVTEFENYRWEMNADGDQFISVSDESFVQNELTLRSGSVSDGLFAGAAFDLKRSVVLMHDKPWSVEWTSEGNRGDQKNGGMLLATTSTSESIYAPYLYLNLAESLIALGERRGEKLHNHGLMLSDYGIDTTVAHKYVLNNELTRDANGEVTANMVYLYVDGVKLGALEHYYTDTQAMDITSSWVSGKDFVFSNIGTAEFTVDGCAMDYLQIKTHCDHSFGEWSVITEAGCVEDGTLACSCALCAQMEKQTIPAFGHSFTSAVTAPTCINNGYTTYTCSTCDYTYNDNKIEALGHSNETVTVDATCIADGSITDTCTVCGNVEVYDIPADGHSYVSVVDAPSCTNDGIETFTCVGCGDSYTEILIATGHNYKTADRAPTCTENGYTTHTCLKCGDSYVTDVVEAVGHSYEAVVTAPTCTEAGYTTYTCACGDTYTADEVAALGHSYETVTVEATCAEDGSITDTCATCGDTKGEVIPAKGHSYADGTCTACGAADPDYVAPIVKPTLKLKAPTLEFKDMITVNAFFTAENIEDVVEMGMITYSYKADVVSVETAEHRIPGAAYIESSGRYLATSQGIHAKYLGDTVYLAVYAELKDGSYVYTILAPYSPVDYATNQIKNSTNVQLKQLCAAMLNYGAEAQLFFGHNTSALANATLTDEQKALPEAYRSDMVAAVPAASVAKQGAFANNKGFAKRTPSISFEGAFCINYFFTPNYAPVDGITMYYWNEADYNAVDVLSVENASGSFKMNGSGASQYNGSIEGIAAKALSEAVYVAATYSDGTTTWTSGVLGYSIGSYCSSQASKGAAVSNLAMATAVYGYQAKQYFG